VPTSTAHRTALAAQFSLVFVTPCAWAQTAAADPATELDTVVVVGALTDAELDREAIEHTQAATLADLFRSVPSVSVGGGVGIAQKIYVRGLEDSMLNVTVDGAPQRGTLFHHVGRVSIEPELLESVDVQAGAGEATSGFGAIGGAIRFRTRDATDLLRDGENVGGIVKAGWASNDGYRVSTTGFARLHEDIGILASFVHVDNDDYEDGDDVTLRGTGARQRLGFVKLGGDLSDSQRFSASFEIRREDGEFGQRPNWPVLEGQPLFPVEGERRTGVVNYGHELSDAFNIEATGYWTQTTFEQDRYDRWGRYGADIDTFGFDLRGRWRMDAHRLTFGVEHRDDKVSSAYLAAPEQWQPWAWDPAIGRFQESGQLLGVYVQDQWQATEALILSFGARYDDYQLDLDTYGGGSDSDDVSLNAGGSYRLTDALTFNLSWAEAFRGKEIGDAFTLEQRPGRLTLSPTLQPETVDNAEIGLQYERDGFTASAVYYEMTIDDVVLDQLGSGPAPQGGTYYENVGRFRSDGIELRAGYDAGVFAVDGYYNRYDSRLNDRRIEGYEHIALGNSMGDNWNLTLRFEPSECFGMQAGVSRVESLDNIEVLFREADLGFIDGTRFIDKPGYTVVDVFSWWRPFESQEFELNAGVYNLFDKAYRAHASVADYGSIPGYEMVAGLNEPGRNFRITASYRF
jgi:hemoglobin/transferrin/lactoferrin receptor protein